MTRLPTVNTPTTCSAGREGWRLKAGEAKDTWLPGTLPIESALERTFHDAIKFAAAFLEAEGQAQLAIKLRARVERKA